MEFNYLETNSICLHHLLISSQSSASNAEQHHHGIKPSLVVIPQPQLPLPRIHDNLASTATSTAAKSSGHPSSFSYVEISPSSATNTNTNLSSALFSELFSFVIAKLSLLAEMGIGLAVSHKQVVRGHSEHLQGSGIGKDHHARLSSHSFPTTNTTTTASFIYLFDLLHRQRHEKQQTLSSFLNNVIPKKYLDALGFRYDVLDLSSKSACSGGASFTSKSSNDSVSISLGENTNASDPEADRLALMSALSDALYNWFEGILTPRGWVRFGYLFVWDRGDKDEPDISGEWARLFQEEGGGSGGVKSPVKRARSPTFAASSSASAKSPKAEKAIKLESGERIPKSALHNMTPNPMSTSSVSAPQSIISAVSAIDLGISLCTDMGLIFNPVQVPFDFEKLEPRHFVDGRGPKHVFIAPNAIEASLCPPLGVYMDKMNILLQGKQMPVSFDSTMIYVPKGTWKGDCLLLSPESTRNSSLHDQGKSYLEKAELFWGQINENAPFAMGGETGDDSPLLINNQMLSSSAGGATSHERGGSGNRSKKDGKTSTSQQDRKKAGNGGATTTGTISPKLPGNSPATTSAEPSKKTTNSPNVSKAPTTTSLTAKQEISPAPQKPINSYLDIHSNLPINVSFNTQTFGGLALDMVDDDDFDFFETKTNSAGDPSGSAIQGTVTAVVDGGGAPTPGPALTGNDGGSVLGLSPPPGATPYADPATPFVFSPPPVVMHDTKSPGGTAIHNMYATTPDTFRSPGYQSFSPPHKSTPATPFGFVQSPNTPGPSYDTPRSGSQFAPFHFEAKIVTIPVVAQSLGRMREDEGEAQDFLNAALATCPPAWLPFEMDFDSLFDTKEYGSDGKWNWKPTVGLRKKETFSLKPFRHAHSAHAKSLYDTRGRTKKKQDAVDFYPSLKLAEVRLVFPFSSSYIPVGKVDVLKESLFYREGAAKQSEDWHLHSLHECVTQLFYFSKDVHHPKVSLKTLSRELWGKLRSLCSHSVLSGERIDGGDVGSAETINLPDFLKVEDDEDSNFAIYGTIKLRKKKGKSSVVEPLPPPQLLVSHNSSSIVCNQEVLRFWSKCRIAPVSGPKDVKWISLFPKAPSILLSQRIPFYMSQIEATWDLLSFGVFEPCHLSNQSVPGLVPVNVSDNHKDIYEHIMANYYKNLPSLAESIIEQVLTTQSHYCMVVIWNPFPADDFKAIFDICCLFYRLVHLIQVGSSNSTAYITARVYLEIANTRDLFSMLDRDHTSRNEAERRCFMNYNRMQRLFDGQYQAHSPAFSIENVQTDPKFSLEYPQTLSPLLLFEPDRIIYLFYGASTGGNQTFCFWSDSFGEFKHQGWHSRFPNEEILVEHLLEKTFALVGRGGFIPRLVVCNVDGWTLASAKVWKLAMHVHSDLLKGDDAHSGGSTEEQPNSAATTPTSSLPDVGAAKIFPSTPGSAYTTPQPDRLPNTRDSRIHAANVEGDKSLPVLGSLSLISCRESRLGVFSKFPESKHGPDEFFTLGTNIQYTPCNKIIPWSKGELPSMAKSWILREGDDGGSVEGSLLWHWQAEYSTTCFSHWHESGHGRRTNIIKDIMRGLYNQKITNEREEWMFQRVVSHLLLISKLSQ